MVAVLAVALAAPARAADPDPWFGTDKVLHFSFSAGIAGAGYAVTAAFTQERWVRLLVGGAVALAAGGAKELLDPFIGGTASWKDFFWDVIGVAVGLALSYVLDRFVITPLSVPRPQPTG